MILNPHYMTWTDWSDSMNLFTEIGTSTTMKTTGEKDWQDWAQNLVGDPDEIGRDAPSPYYYDDWRTWATAFFLANDIGHTA